jgi:phosphoribosylformylglycinamidine synthase
MLFYLCRKTKRIMTYNVQIKVMPLKDLLDPQGKAVMGGLKNLGISSVEDVRIGNISLCK